MLWTFKSLRIDVRVVYLSLVPAGVFFLTRKQITATIHKVSLMIKALLHHLPVALPSRSGHQLGAAPASPSSCHPHGPARGPPAAAAAAAAAGAVALSARSADTWNGPGRRRRRRGRCLGAGAAAAAGAVTAEAEAADPAADPHCRVPAAARAAVPPA